MQKKHVNNCEAVPHPRKKERRIVTWTPEEDDILREQICIHGTENWTVIASKFEDKTTRQCRRRWYTYLNSDFKSGGWSPEEDNLLCEAQKIYGNRWTEIAKVVSGRTDNAVKNRFTTLCKKRAKCDALVMENNATCMNTNNKSSISDSNVLDSHGLLHVGSPLKKMRIAHIPNLLDTCDIGSVSDRDCTTEKKQIRRPFAVLAQNRQNVDYEEQMIPEAFTDIKLRDISIHRQPDLYDSPSSSEYSTSSMILSNNASEQIEQSQSEICTLSDDAGAKLQNIGTREEVLLPCAEAKNEGGVSAVSAIELSPSQVTPVFRSLAATIPSPQFSESERQFLRKTLGVESPAPSRSTNPSQPPPCRKALVHSL